jgi:MFS family permease
MTTETLLVVTPLYLVTIELDGQDERTRKEVEKTLLPLISLLISLSLFLIIPVGYFFQKKIMGKIGERTIILYLTIICFLFNILIFQFVFTSVYQYCLIFIFFIISTNLLENTLTSMFSKIIPSDYNIYGINGGFFINVSTCLGRSLGCCIITFIGSVRYQTLNRICFGVTGGLILFGLIVFISFYNTLRIKAIARILRGRASIRKHKATEF